VVGYNKHHLSEYEAQAHAVASKNVHVPVASNKTSGYESVSDSEFILDILEELDSTPRSPYHPETELVSDGEIDKLFDILKEVDISSPVAVFYAVLQCALHYLWRECREQCDVLYSLIIVFVICSVLSLRHLWQSYILQYKDLYLSV